MAKRNRVRDIDRGWAQLKKNLPEIAGAHVKVGFPTDVGKKTKKPGKNQKAEDLDEQLTVALVAWWQEFGTKNQDGSTRMPSRSFLRSTHDENLRKLKRVKQALVLKMLDGEMTIGQAVTILGEWMVDKVRAKIVNLSSPANAASTIAQKGSSNPLVDIGQMLGEVTYEVVVPKKGVKRTKV